MGPTLGTFAAMAAVLLLIGPPEGATARPAEVPASIAQSLRSGTALEYTPPRHIGVHIGVARVLDALARGMVVGASRRACRVAGWIWEGKYSDCLQPPLRHHAPQHRRQVAHRDARPHVVGEAAQLP